MRLLLISLALLFLAACASETEEDLDATELEFYQKAQGSLRSSNFDEGVRRLQLLEARFPFGRYAEQAQLEIIYAYYKSNQAESARAAADRFIRLHPQHPNVDYAYYLRGMASFDEDQNFLAQFLPLDLSTRDPGAARESFNDFSGAYIAAANRGRYVFENYQETPSVPEALAVMVEAYQLLDMKELADEALLVLTSNYPAYSALDKNGKLKRSASVKSNERSWVSRLTFGLMG